MTIQDFMIYAISALAPITVGIFAYQVWKKGGLKAALLGGRIGRTVGTLDLGRSRPVTTTLKVHSLESAGPGKPTVGIELVFRSAFSYHMTPISLTSEQAYTLGEFLSQAAAESQGAYRQQAH